MTTLQSSYGSVSRGTMQPSKKETPEEKKNRLQRQAAADVKIYKRALKQAMERYNSYDIINEEVHEGSGFEEGCKKITHKPRG